MPIDSDSFLSRYPLFDGATSLENIDLLISEAYYDLDANSWSDSTIRDRAASLMVAHRLQLERKNLIEQGLALNALEENKPFKVAYDANDLNYWKQTIFGVEFLTLRKRVLGIAMFVV